MTSPILGPILGRRTLLQLMGATAAAGALAGLPRGAFAAPLTIDQIKSKGLIRVGCEAAYRPFTFRDGAKIVGYDVDLADVMYKPLGVKIEFVDTAWSGVIPALYAGNFDVVMCSMTYTKERIEKVGFSIPYAEATQEMLIRAADADKIKGIDDMAGKIMGVKLGSAGDTMKKGIDDKLKAKFGKGFAEVKTYDDHPAAYLSLAQGSIDGVINALPTLTQVMKDAPGKYAIVRNIGPVNWAGIAARKEDTDIIAFVDKRLNELKASGEIYALQEKWFGVKMNLSDTIPTMA